MTLYVLETVVHYVSSTGPSSLVTDVTDGSDFQTGEMSVVVVSKVSDLPVTLVCVFPTLRG